MNSDAASVASTASAPTSARGSLKEEHTDTHAGAHAGCGKKAVEDEDALKLMHKNVAAAIADAAASGGAAGHAATYAEGVGGALPLPNVWVSRWVDYSKKYGLGYKLSNNQYGVFFNDATKILLKTDGERSVRLDYITTPKPQHSLLKYSLVLT